LSARFKIYGGSASSLCEHCINGQVTKGFSAGQEFVICSASYENPCRIEWPVAECTEFREKESTSLTLMKEMAWHISPKVRGKVGFAPPGAERDKAEREFVEGVIGVLKSGTD
jgi:hypothetical protein